MKKQYYFLIGGIAFGYVLANYLVGYPPFTQLNNALNGGADITTPGTVSASTALG